jgi:hypothetical protein
MSRGAIILTPTLIEAAHETHKDTDNFLVIFPVYFVQFQICLTVSRHYAWQEVVGVFAFFVRRFIQEPP